MAITAPTMRSDFGGFLPPAMSAPIFEQAQRSSVVMQLAQRTPLGAEGQTIPVVTGRLSAGWVAEGDQKPASNAALGLVNITPRKLAAIAVVSNETVRANPGNYMTLLRSQVGEAFAQAFDLAALHDMGPDGTPGGGPFATWLDQSAHSVEIGTATQANGGIHGDLVAALSLLVADRKRLTGWALDDTAEPLLWGAVDGNGRPLYVDLPTDTAAAGLARPGTLLRRPSYMGDLLAAVADDDTVGYGGDWRMAAWGVVGGITYDLSTEAAVTINGELQSLWERNLVAIRAEAEYGFVVADPDAFVRLVNAV